MTQSSAGEFNDLFKSIFAPQPSVDLNARPPIDEALTMAALREFNRSLKAARHADAELQVASKRAKDARKDHAKATKILNDLLQGKIDTTPSEKTGLGK